MRKGLIRNLVKARVTLYIQFLLEWERGTEREREREIGWYGHVEKSCVGVNNKLEPTLVSFSPISYITSTPTISHCILRWKVHHVNLIKEISIQHQLNANILGLSGVMRTFWSEGGPSYPSPFLHRSIIIEITIRLGVSPFTKHRFASVRV